MPRHEDSVHIYIYIYIYLCVYSHSIILGLGLKTIISGFIKNAKELAWKKELGHCMDKYHVLVIYVCVHDFSIS